nr:hypothetical protein [Tanacetum cinerariifolium]
HIITRCFPDAPPDPDANGLDEPVVMEFCLPCIGWMVTLPLLISMKYHSVDKRLIDLMMMVLVRQTEEYDMMLHMEKTGKSMLVAKIKVGDMTADD